MEEINFPLILVWLITQTKQCSVVIKESTRHLLPNLGRAIACSSTTRDRVWFNWLGSEGGMEGGGILLLESEWWGRYTGARTTHRDINIGGQLGTKPTVHKIFGAKYDTCSCIPPVPHNSSTAVAHEIEDELEALVVMVVQIECKTCFVNCKIRLYQ